MVFSASSVEALLADEASYTVFLRQLLFAVVGAVAAGFASRLDVRWWKRLAFPIVACRSCCSRHVIPFGRSVNGNQNWLAIGPIQFQPSEFAKLGLVLVGAVIFANKSARITSVVHVVLPFLVPICAVVIGLILAGKDLGTAMVVIVIVAAVLLVAGAPMRCLRRGEARWPPSGSACCVTGSSNRTSRITDFLDPTCKHQPRRVVRPVGARPVRARRRRLVGRRARGLQGEVGLALRGAQRLHLRHHR